MSNILHSNKSRLQRLWSLLGLTLDGSRLDGVVLRRNNGSLEVQQTFSVSLSLDLLTAEAELVGREIRNHLDAAGVRERHCVVGLPLKWALTTHVELPEMEEADVASFLEIEAEKGFPADVTTLHSAVSRSRSAGTPEQVLLVGVPRAHLTALESALRAAKLKPLSFSFGITALQPIVNDPLQGVLALAIGETHVALEITCGGGVVALRALEGTVEAESARRAIHSEVVAREARITLGQLPPGLRDKVHLARIFGPRDLAQQLADELELRLESTGLKVEIVTRYAADEFGLHLPSEAQVSSALSLAASRLAARKPAFELLPPRVTPWQAMTSRYATGRYRMAGAAATIVLLILAGAFGFQQWQLTRYRSQWAGMARKVGELQTVSDQIHQYRPWFDQSLRGLTILRQLTTAFPEDGVVTAKTVEIRDLNVVTCTGTTRDLESLFKVQDKLRANPEVSDVRLVQGRGSKPPLQFTFDFRWTPGGKE